ncbi:hypothetical protein ACHAPT_009386 [Fusarium lateritium]
MSEVSLSDGDPLDGSQASDSEHGSQNTEPGIKPRGYVSYDPVPKPPRHMSLVEKRHQHREWKAAGYPSGILIAKKFKATLGSSLILSEYLFFANNKSFISWVDHCLPDVCRLAAYVASEGFDKTFDESIGDDEDMGYEDSDDLESELFLDLYRKGANFQGPKELRTNLPPPIEILQAYQDEHTRAFVDRVYEAVTKPTLVPVLKGDSDDLTKLALDPVIFILVHAVQILKFAPINFDMNIDFEKGILSRSTPKSKVAFPGYADPTFQVLETDETQRTAIDLAINYHCRTQFAFEAREREVKRHLEGRKAKYEDQNVDRFFGHVVPEEEAVEDVAPIVGADALDLHERVMEICASTNLRESIKANNDKLGIKDLPFMWDKVQRALVESLLDLHPIIDHEAEFEKIRGQLDHFTKYLNPDEQADFMKQQSECPAILEYAKKHPGNLEGLTNEIERQHALEKVTSSLQPEHNYDPNELSELYKIPKYPNLRLYPSSYQTEALKAHQFNDAHHFIQRLNSPQPYMILANEIGTGKTKTFLAAILLRVKRLQADFPKYDQYYPTLLLGPVSTIEQTHEEITKHFPSLTVLIYYSESGAFPAGTKVLGTREMSHEMKRLNSARGRKDPETGRTIVLSTYPTMSRRVIRKAVQPFRWLDDHAPASVKKKRSALAETPGRGNKNRKVKKFAPDSVDREKIEMLQRGSSESPDGNLVVYLHSNDQVPSWSFDLLICDESQFIKRESGSYHQMLRLLTWRRLLFVSGTPLSSSLRDLLSPLSLISHVNSRIRSLRRLEEKSLRWVPGLYSPNYDPMTEINRLGGGKLTAGIFHERFLQDVTHEETKVALIEMREAWANEETRFPVWLLSPDLLKLAATELGWGTKLGATVIKPILKHLYIRRTKRSPTQLPDGTLTYPSSASCLISVDEVSYHPDSEVGKEVKARGRLYADKANTVKGRLNMDVHRVAVVTAFDPRNIKLLEPKEPLFCGSKARLEKHLTRSAKTPLARPSLNADVVLGVEHVEELVKSSVDGGLIYLWYQTRTERDILASSDRAVFLRWFAAESPIMIRTFDLLLQYVRRDRERVLIFVDTPWIQSVVVSVLTRFGYVVATVRSSNSAAEKAAIISQWNNPDSNLQIFVANMQTMSVGVNLHRCCSKGISMSWHHSAKVMQQMVGRLNRLGQRGAVRFHFLKVIDSYHDNIEMFNITELMAQLSAEIALPEYLEYELLEICLCEVIKHMWHTPFNRYSWIVEQERSKGDMAYHSEHVHIMGHVFSMMARILMGCSEAERSFWSENAKYVVEAARRISEPQRGSVRSIKLAEKWLAIETGKLEGKLRTYFEKQFHELETEFAKNPGSLRRNEGLRQAVMDRRAKGLFSELSDDSTDSESDDCEDGEVSEDEGGIVANKGSTAGKRKNRKSDTDTDSDDVPSTRMPAQKRPKGAGSKRKGVTSKGAKSASKPVQSN